MVSSGSMPSKTCVFALGKRLVLIQLFAQWFQPRRNNTVGALKVEGLYQLLYLTRIRLILDAGIGPLNDPIQDSALLGVLRSRTNATALAQLVVRLQLTLEPVEVRLCTGGGEVIAVHAADQVPFFVPKDARTGDALVESQFVDQRGAVLSLLAIGCGLSTVHVLHQRPTSTLVVRILRRQTYKIRILGVALSVK